MKAGVQPSKSQQDKSQEKPNSASNGVLIGLSPLPGWTPAVLPAGVTSVMKETDHTEPSAPPKADRAQKKDTDSEQTTTASVAQAAISATQPIPAIVAPVSAAPVNTTSVNTTSVNTAPVNTAPVNTAPVPAPQPEESTSSRAAIVPVGQAPVQAALPLAVSPSVARPAPNTPEPPVTFVLELKPAEHAIPAQPAPAAHAVDRNAPPAADALAATGARVSAPVIMKPDTQTGNQQQNSSDTGRDRHTSNQEVRPRREEPMAPADDPKSVETILKPAGVTPPPANERPTIQRESLTEAAVPAEPIARPSAIATAVQPKQAAVREISFQSTSPDAGPVKVQLIDRGGDIRISVRSSDPNLTHALQRDVGQLVTKLDHAGYETKVWNPRDTSPLTAATGVRDIEIRPDAGSGNSASPDPGSRGNQGGGQEHSQQQRRQGDARQWANALNETARRAITDDEEDLWQ